MKSPLTSLSLIAVLFSTFSFPPSAQATSQPPIYVSIVTHNEDVSSGRYPNFQTDEDAFWEQRDAVIAFADMLHSEGVSYNWQSAWTFLEAARSFDTGDGASDGKNIVQYLQDLGFSVNVHGHPGIYSYADDAYLIDQLGDAPSGLMGGFVATPGSASELEDLWETQTGSVYSYSWTPTMLWGAAGSGHQGNDDIQVSGVWKPEGNNVFLTHSDHAPLPVIGGYTSDWDGLDELLQLQSEGELNPNLMHTAAIMVDQDELLTQADRDAVQEKIEALQDETDAGRIIWMGLEDVEETWETTYNSYPGIYQASSQSYLSTSTNQETPDSSSTGTTTVSPSTETTSSTTVAAGTLIKSACSDGATADDPCKAVYYVGTDGKRHAFPNEKVYFTWYDDFSSVEEVSSSTLGSYALGKNVTYHPGIQMVKFLSVPTVYAVEQGGVLRAIASETIAGQLYGETWNHKIDDISDAFYANYTIGESIDNPTDYNVNDAQASTLSIDENW